jgi:anti-anti-sigma factor
MLVCDDRPSVADEGALDVRRSVDPDGYARVSLTGEMDHANSGALLTCLDELKRSGESVRLDLSQLQFIDSGGVQAILRSVREADRATWQLEVDSRLSWQVKQVFDVLGLDAVLWPQGPS